MRLLEFINWREKATKRESKFIRILFFISSTVWKILFSREASLEKSADKDQCMVVWETDKTVPNLRLQI
jgi:hypothetical protein